MKKLIRIMFCLAVVLGCLTIVTPTKVEAKKFSKKQVKMYRYKAKGFMLPEDDVSCKEVILFVNKNKKAAEVTFDLVYYKGKGDDKVEIFRSSNRAVVMQVDYVGIGNEEELGKYTSCEIQNLKIKKLNLDRIAKSKVKIKTKKKYKKAGYKKITIKNNSDSRGQFEIVNVFYNKKGKPVYFSSTTPLDINAGDKATAYIDYKYSGKKYKKVKTYYNFMKLDNDEPGE